MRKAEWNKKKSSHFKKQTQTMNHNALFMDAVDTAREELAPFAAVPGVVDTFLPVPKGRQCPGARIHLLQDSYREEAAAAFVAGRPQEYSTLEDFKLESVHLAAKSARSLAVYHAALAAAYNAMTPVLDELCDEADRLFA